MPTDQKTHEVTTLSNGLELVHVPTPGVESAYIKMLGSAGANYETEEQIGVAHFLEHILFDGTKNYPTSKKLNDIIEDVGGQNNGSTGREQVQYYARLLKEDISRGFEYLSEMIQYSLLREEDIAREKTIIEQELARLKDNPNAYLGRKFGMNLHTDSRSKQFVLGEKEDIKKITKETLETYLSSHYTAQNFTLGVAADLPLQQVIELAESHFGSINQGTKNNPQAKEWDKSNHLFIENRNDLQQSTFFLGFPGFTRYQHEDPALTVLGQILGGGMSSRLFQLIREEKGYVYSVSAGGLATVNDGVFYIYAGLDEKNINETLQLIKGEVERIATEPVSPEEFERAQKSAAAAFIFGLESPVAQVDYYTELTHFNLPFKNHHEDLERYLQVTPKDLTDIAQKVFTTQPKLTMLTPSYTEREIEWLW